MRTQHFLHKYGSDDLHADLIPDLAASESTQYIGRAVAALAADPNVMSRSGQVLTAGAVAQDDGFTDVDGRYIPPFPLPADTIVD